MLAKIKKMRPRLQKIEENINFNQLLERDGGICLLVLPVSSKNSTSP